MTIRPMVLGIKYANSLPNTKQIADPFKLLNLLQHYTKNNIQYECNRNIIIEKMLKLNERYKIKIYIKNEYIYNFSFVNFFYQE